MENARHRSQQAKELPFSIKRMRIRLQPLLLLLMLVLTWLVLVVLINMVTALGEHKMSCLTRAARPGVIGRPPPPSVPGLLPSCNGIN
jgi:hypothetical protein